MENRIYGPSRSDLSKQRLRALLLKGWRVLEDCMYHANVFYSFLLSSIMYVKLCIMGRNDQFGILYIRRMPLLAGWKRVRAATLFSPWQWARVQFESHRD